MFVGHTNDFHEMINHLIAKHANAKIVCVGFSLGGNLITKYMGEIDRNKPSHIIGAISICQGYCAIELVCLLIYFFICVKQSNDKFKIIDNDLIKILPNV